MTWLVVGAGFTGATVAERLASAGKRVLVVERRARVGGSAEDYRTDDGLLVQKYGPHVFHTNSQKVWDYVQRFGEWRAMKYKVGARVSDNTYRLPLDFDVIRHDRDLIGRLTTRYGLGARVGIMALRREFPDFAEWCIDHVFRGYNEKHWGLPFEEVPASVLARLPFVVGEQESYFTDKYQAIPVDGYTALIERMLDHPNIEVVLNYDVASLQEFGKGAVWTGSPDAFFGEEGALPYRSVKFLHDKVTGHATEHGIWQGGYATITYPSLAAPQTRITSMRRHRYESAPGDVLVSDLPGAYISGENDPFYPIPLEANIRKAQEYESRLPKNVWFAGRLGTYTYLNMDQAIAQGLALVERIRAC